MLELLALIIGIIVIAAVVLAAGAFSVFLFGALLMAAFFLTKTLAIVLLLLLVPLAPFLLIALLFRLARGRTLPGTSMPMPRALSMVIFALAIIGIYALAGSFRHGFSDLRQATENGLDLMNQCNDPGTSSVDIVIDGKVYHFSCHSEGHVSPDSNGSGT